MSSALKKVEDIGCHFELWDRRNIILLKTKVKEGKHKEHETLDEVKPCFLQNGAPFHTANATTARLRENVG